MQTVFYGANKQPKPVFMTKIGVNYTCKIIPLEVIICCFYNNVT